MAWLNDVAPNDTIQSLWGNTIRSRVVWTFDTIAERDSHGPTMPVGTLAVVLATDTLYERRGAGWRTVHSPSLAYVPPVSVGVVNAPGVNVLWSRWRRSYGTRINAEVVLICPPCGPGAVAVGLPVPIASYSATRPILGWASIRKGTVGSSPPIYQHGPAIAVTDAAVSLWATNDVAATVEVDFEWRMNVSYESAEF